MTDLLGDDITQPHCAASILKRSAENLAAGFVEFWQSWPKGPRKVAKQKCLDRWARLECCQCSALIVAHVEWMKKQDDWLRDNGRYTPMPHTYLGRMPWAEWEQPAIRPRAPTALEKIKADELLAVPAPAHIREQMKAIARQA